MGHLAQDCTMTEQEGRDRLRAEAGTTRETRSTSESSSLVKCINCGEYGCNKFRCPKPPFERRTAGREGLKAAGQALSIKAATRSVTYNPSPNLPKMERMGDNNGDIFMEDESGNIWWRDC